MQNWPPAFLENSKSYWRPLNYREPFCLKPLVIRNSERSSDTGNIPVVVVADLRVQIDILFVENILDRYSNSCSITKLSRQIKAGQIVTVEGIYGIFEGLVVILDP